MSAVQLETLGKPQVWGEPYYVIVLFTIITCIVDSTLSIIFKLNQYLLKLSILLYSVSKVNISTDCDDGLRMS